ncbi:MAG: right-handed parallel beta-helix repeat-containing protein [Deltaproteobacteria bacterium]|nr:right-handed parallel beta-helix repeat-containing protein [Deltaproteobacteria bacterium]
MDRPAGEAGGPVGEAGWPVGMIAGVCLFLSFFLFSVSWAKDIIVPTDRSTIQGAVDSAAPGDAVVIEDGRYAENVVITKAITVRGRSGYAGVIIEAKNAELPVVKVHGVTGAVVTGVTAKGSNAYGIHFYRSSGCTLSNNRAAANSTGIYLEYSNNNTVSGNVAEGNANEGISLFSSNNNLLSGNNANANSEKGITLLSSSGNTLTGNTADSNYWNGITLWSSNGNTIRNNTALNNTYAMVVSYSEDNDITDNNMMRRIYYLLPVALVYFAIIVYFIEKRLFIIFFSAPSVEAS